MTGTESPQPQTVPKRVLVTGAFGSVGMQIVKYFLETNRKKPEGERVHLTCVGRESKRSKTNWKKLMNISKGNKNQHAFQTLWGDIADPEFISKAVKGHTVVIHLAAVIPPMVYDNPEAARKVNVDATKALLEVCASQDLPPRFIYGSTYSVHGYRNPHKTLPRLDANTPANPQDAYASQKLKAENLIREYKGEWTILRIGAVALSGEEILSYQNRGSETLKVLTYAIPANQRRHSVHSQDAGKAFAECAITDKPVAGKILPLGGDETWCITAIDLSGTILEALGIGKVPAEFYRMPSPEKDEAFYYEDWMDTSETQALLNFQDHTFEDYKRELRKSLASVRRFMMLVAPLARRSLRKDSPYYQTNRSHKPNPENDKPVSELLHTKPDSI